jgi:3-phosphoshikimate 1-carboxyvinyltransferase
LKNLYLEPTPLQGHIRIPPSKSISHRAVICAGLAAGVSRIENVVLSEDIAATLEGMQATGVRIQKIQFLEEQREIENQPGIISAGNPQEVRANKGQGSAGEPENKEYQAIMAKSIETGEALIIDIQGSSTPNMVRDTIDCRESGSTLRFLLPLAARSGTEVTFLGRGKLGERPLDIYEHLFTEQGLIFRTKGESFLPLTVQGGLKPGVFRLEGNVSSQFISGLMFLLPLLEGDSEIIITTELESRGYVDLTLEVLSKFGIKVANSDYRQFYIEGGQKYQHQHYRIEGDYSQAAFWIVAAILGGRIDCWGLNPDSLQGDKAILDIVRKMGADIELKDGMISIPARSTRGTVIDAGQCPDLVPVLAVLGAVSEGTTRIINAGRLRIKESDRLKAIASELNKIGARVQETQDGLWIEGVRNLQGGTVDSWNDHRIAMALAVAAVKCHKPLIINGYDAVKKSYPHFWQDYAQLGGKCYERSLG